MGKVIRKVIIYFSFFSMTCLCQSIESLPLKIFAGVNGLIYCIAFSPNDTLIAIGDGNGRIYVYDVFTNQMRHIINGHSNIVLALDFNREGTLLASGSADKSVKIWDLKVTVRQSRSITTSGGVTSLVIC